MELQGLVGETPLLVRRQPQPDKTAAGRKPGATQRIDPEVARAQKEGDVTRRRRNFDMHLALQPHLMDWFTALSEVLPGRVQFDWPDRDEFLAEPKNKAPEENPRRFDVSVFDALIERLPR